MFDDDTSEGDPSCVRRIKEYRLGRKLAAQHVIPHLRALIDLPAGRLIPALQAARSSIRAIPVPADAVSSFNVKAGFNDGRENVVMDLDRLESAVQAGCNDDCTRRRLSSFHDRERRRVGN